MFIYLFNLLSVYSFCVACFQSLTLSELLQKKDTDLTKAMESTSAILEMVSSKRDLWNKDLLDCSNGKANCCYEFWIAMGTPRLGRQGARFHHTAHSYNMAAEDYSERQLKVVVVGETSSGKTSLVTRFCNNEYSRLYYPTQGVDFVLQRHLIRAGKEVTLIIWDVSGQALTSPLLPYYFYKANVVLLVFDITNAASFTNIQGWLNTVRSMDTDAPPTVAMIANKCDMEHQRATSVEKQVRFANDNGITTHTVSARTGENVIMAIQKVCAEVLGLKLTRIEQEANQTVVKAEIVVPTQNQVYSSYQSSSSTICSLQ